MTTSHRSPRATRTRRTCGALLVTAVAVTGLGVSGVLTPGAAGAEAPQGRSDVVQQQLDGLITDDGFPGALATVRDQDGREREVLLQPGDVFHARVGCEHVAHPRGEARILVVEKEGSA